MRVFHYAVVTAPLLVPAVTQAQALPKSPIQRLVITPSPVRMTAQDTLRLRVQALDANGQPVPNVAFAFQPSSGARFEGTVTQDGLVRSGATGTLPVTVTANLTGYAPVLERVEVVMVPAVPGRVEIVQPIRKLLVGQQIQLAGRVYSIHGEPRIDAITWRTSSPMATVADGKLTAVRPGRVTITGSAGTASSSVDVEIVANTIG